MKKQAEKKKFGETETAARRWLYTLPLCLAGLCLAPRAFGAAAPALPSAGQNSLLPLTSQTALSGGTDNQGFGQAFGSGSLYAPGKVGAVEVVGNRRILPETVLYYMVIRRGDTFNQGLLSRSLKIFYQTGLFKKVYYSRQGHVLIVHVVENPQINRIAFEGTKEVPLKHLKAVIGLSPGSLLTEATVMKAKERILALYAALGYYQTTVTPQIIKLGDGLVNLVFKVHEGRIAYISRILFVGNKYFSSGDLGDVIDSRPEAWWRFFSSSDIYNPEQIEQDKHLLSRYYRNHGFVNFKILAVNAALAPDRSGVFLTFVLHEGTRYRIGKITVRSDIPHLAPQSYDGTVEFSQGDYFNATAVSQTINAMENQAQAAGFPFATVVPTVEPDPKTGTVNVTLTLKNGPRLYIQRINITGNTRTEDQIIRRQFPFAEGDAFNPRLIREGETAIKNLAFFKTVNVIPEQGSAPDEVVLNTQVTEKSTGQLTLGGGYSSDVGFLLDAGVTESNFLGEGIALSLQGVLAQAANQISFSVTNPYFLGRNLLAGLTLFDTNQQNNIYSSYSEEQIGATFSLGYNFNRHVSQQWTYSIAGRKLSNITGTNDPYVLSEMGTSVLSEVSQTLTFDYRNSKINPQKGFIISGTSSFAGLGGTAKYVQVTGSATYYVPLYNLIGDGWDLQFSASGGYMHDLFGYQDKIVDRFFLGGQSFLGFESGGIGPHYTPNGDSLGGRIYWTQSTVLQIPLPISREVGLSAFAFLDTGSLFGMNTPYGSVYDTAAPRVSTGFGFDWQTPMGLINISFGIPLIKRSYDQTQLFNFGFGTRF